ncbi:hypoxanthine phosphoribosyltransferase [Plantactinospora sp. GCM10030261]|uniref:hypoxanthine phosphoribosyltransferase n=1 Tax=Plantactinospora sp. GCM10030261 TaxID=3273420 RepID=UPI0036111C42
MDASHVADDLDDVLFTEAEILDRVAALARALERDHPGRDLLLVGVLGGAATLTVDLARSFDRHVEVGWMAVRSYGSGTSSSGTVSLLKDLDLEITDRHVVIVDDVIDSGLTIAWLVNHLRRRKPASLAVCALLRKPAAPSFDGIPVYVGFEAGSGMLVGYGLDYAGRYRNLRSVAVLAPHVYGAVSAR